MKTAIRKLTASLLFAAATACFAADVPHAPHAPEHLPPGIAWRQGDVDAAFAEAKRTNKPLFLYWGAVWCPSCNQVKSTIFSQQAFKSRSSFFVPVYLDGDTENAQKIGDRFKVRGYPTMILFRPDGAEVTRLPGEVDLDRYMQALSIGLNAAHPFKQTLAAALKGGARMTPDDWRVLADYSWDTDGDLPVPNERVATTLQTLASHARADHANAEALRLELKAVVSAALGDPPQQGDIDKTAGAAAVRDALRDPKRARADYDVLVAAPADVVQYLAGGGDAAARASLAKQFDAALARLSADTSLAAIDRTMALHGRVRVTRLDAKPGAPLPPALADAVRRQTASAVAESTNVYARQAVVSEAADTLTDAGQFDAAGALLKAELARSPTPYYFMSGLAANAKARGDRAAALDWYRKAYEAASGPATRLRWGAAYFANAVDLAPDDAARIRQIANDVLTQAGQTRNAFYGANRRALTRVIAQLAHWRQRGAHDATVQAVVKQFEAVCGKLPAGDPQVGTCESLIKTAKV
ncbi:thioredoxin domain protein [Burkholderia sp. ABCPW 14]|uniref:thioredoxin family protein n=1 Tax=Burkholderia sp. ABCPW 14 TaxID=1637860 RepID=UPI000770BB25|nr:thioredoxin family protein [Burkholderia sp. ABCPW 14]KVD80574.1 thioredoxin domain protein [Burkholderia sp. ABCPW 14]